MRAGVWAHLPLRSCTLRGRPVSRPGNLHYKGGCFTRSNPVRVAKSLTSIQASADTTMSRAHILLALLVSAYKASGPTQIKYPNLVKRVIMKQPRTRPGPGPPLSWVVSTCPAAPPQSVTQGGVGIPGPSLPGWNHLSFQPPHHDPSVGTLRADPTLVTI